MKDVKLLIFFALGIVSASIITVGAYTLTANNVLIDNSDWNVSNTKDAIDYLKNKSSCPGLAPKVIKLVDGNLNKESIVSIGNEEFYVIDSNDTETTLFAKYNIDTNNNQNIDIYSSDKLQVSFSEEYYWSDRNIYPASGDYYVYNENSNLYAYVENYVNKLKELGISNVRGRLITKSEASGLSKNARISVGEGGSAKAVNYFTGSFARWGSNYNHIWSVNASGEIKETTYSSEKYVRPVIIVPTNEIV